MLVLERKPGEQIRIGPNIIVTQLAGGRIGIEAPREVLILRAELGRPRPADDSADATAQ